MSKEIEDLLDLKENHYRGYLSDDEYIEKINKILDDYVINYNKSADNSNSNEALECMEEIVTRWSFRDKERDEYFEDTKEFKTIKQALLKFQETEKENELLKEIINSLFDKGCPLHQYTNKEGALLIEVDDECSIMHLGEFKGVDLDKKLNEVLKNE